MFLLSFLKQGQRVDKKILRDEYERQAGILISGDLVDADLLPPRRLTPAAGAIAREYRMVDDRAMDDPLQRVRPPAARRRLSMIP